ncbi:hypothetical protein BGX30_013275 [Mortierella sp. GBA39]|nr:hypothetical protein BGX30_013275 [Mortierella sp. GBA39]
MAVVGIGAVTDTGTMAARIASYTSITTQTLGRPISADKTDYTELDCPGNGATVDADLAGAHFAQDESIPGIGTAGHVQPGNRKKVCRTFTCQQLGVLFFVMRMG